MDLKGIRIFSLVNRSKVQRSRKIASQICTKLIFNLLAVNAISSSFQQLQRICKTAFSYLMNLLDLKIQQRALFCAAILFSLPPNKIGGDHNKENAL